MALKGVIQKDHIPANKYKLMVGVKEIIATSVSAIEQTLVTTDLPDGTRASSGRTEASECTVMIPAHHNGDIAFMQAWWHSGGANDGPVLPTTYKPMTVIGTSGTGAVNRIDTCFGCFITGRTSSEYSMEDGGTMTVIEYTISIDRVLSF